MDDEGRDRDCLQLGSQVSSEACQEERRCRPRRAVKALPDHVQAKDDKVAAALLAELRGYTGSLVHGRPPAPVSVGDLLLPIHIRTDDFELRIFSTIMTLGTPQDVTLQE